MERIEASTMTRQFKRTFGEQTLNELGKMARFCRRERQVTPFRLALSLIESFAGGTVKCIADIQRGFNALCESDVQYKPFHNQLAKRQFPTFVRLLLSRLLNELACEVLRFAPESPFARFDHIRIQDGTSFAVKRTLAETFPGRFTTISPAAVELHVDLDLMSEIMNRVVLSPDSAAERQFLPDVEEITGGLLLGDRGYYGNPYLQALDAAGGFFIVRGKSNINPLILRAIGADGREVKRLRNRRLKEVAGRLSKYEHLDMKVRFGRTAGSFECRLVVHPNPRENKPRYLVTNLEPKVFTPQHISDGYRLRWQVELLFKEWKSHANLHAFDTSNPYIAEGLIWASLCAATLKRYCAHMTQRLANVAMSTQIVAKCIHHVLGDVLHALIHQPRRLNANVARAIEYLANNARRAHPKRDRRTGRLKLGLEHVYGAA
jgi:hypothetical protein